MEVMRYITFAFYFTLALLLFKYANKYISRAWLFVFNTISYIYSKYKSLSHQKVYWINLRLKDE